jgi:hypothetical protein
VSALLESAISVCAHKNADYSRNRINREIDPTGLPSGDIELQNLNYCAKDHRPNAQNPLATRVRQTEQDARDHECRGVLDIMGRVSRRPKVRRQYCEYHNGRQRRPRHPATR